MFSYKDIDREASENAAYIAEVSKNNAYSPEKHKEMKKVFGTAIWETDLDLAPETLLDILNCRQETELVMKYYNQACKYSKIKFNNDYEVLASEFCDFLASLLTCKLVNYFDECQLFESMTYGQIMDHLASVKKVSLPGTGWTLPKLSPRDEEILTALKLLPPETD